MILTIRHKRHFLEPKLPHLIFLRPLTPARGAPEKLIPVDCLCETQRPTMLLMKGDELKVEIPWDYCDVRIQCGGVIPLRLISRIRKKATHIDLSVSSTTRLEMPFGNESTITFRDRERLWNILFDIDLVLWLVSLFVAMPLAYKIISDAFFAIWLIRLIVIRKRYYIIETEQP